MALKTYILKFFKLKSAYKSPTMETTTDNLDLNNVNNFILPITKAKVIKVYDCDTITVAFRFKNSVDIKTYKVCVRLNGIDSPEIKTNNPDEKECGIKARDYLRDILMDKEIELTDVSYDKYGRILAEVYLDGQHINQRILDDKMAIKYTGGTKKKNFDWKTYMNNYK